MKSCQNCIHAVVCKKWWNDEDVVCPHRETESEALHILRLLYADLSARANACRERAGAHRNPQSSARLLIEMDAHARDASRVKIYCHRIGFDPSANGGEADK